MIIKENKDKQDIKQAAEVYKIEKEPELPLKMINLRVIKSCPYLLPCGCCDKRNGEMCSQYGLTVK